MCDRREVQSLHVDIDTLHEMALLLEYLQEYFACEIVTVVDRGTQSLILYKKSNFHYKTSTIEKDISDKRHLTWEKPQMRGEE